MQNIESFYRLTEYRYHINQKKPYPLLDVHLCETSYHSSREDALKALKRNSGFPGTYCFVLDELPMGLDLSEDESLSETVFDENGRIVASRPFAVLSDMGHEGSTTEEWIDWFGKVRHFDGWKDEDLKFYRGDIVEIHRRPGNRFFGNGGAELGIIAEMPPEPESHLNDCYGVLTLDGGAHLDHAPVTAVMKPHFPIQYRFKFHLQTNYLIWMKESGLLEV